MCPLGAAESFAEGFHGSVHGAVGDRKLFPEGHHDIAAKRRIAGEIKVGNRGALHDRMYRHPADFLVQGAEPFKPVTLLGGRALAVGILDLPQDAVTLALDQAWASEKEPSVPRKTISQADFLWSRGQNWCGESLAG